MRFQVIRLLTPNEVHSLAAGLAGRIFESGKRTAGLLGQAVKENLQTDRQTQDLTELDSVLSAALDRNREFQAFAIPKRILAPTFSLYRPGMHYGPHVDNAFMGSPRLRTDLAMTVFLSDPASYDGGELVIEMPMGEQEIKLDSGEAIVYPADSVHRVAPVTRGERLAAVTWIESCVGDERLREIIADLVRAMEAARAAGQSELAVLLAKSYNNLLRYAAHT